jgi:hypothetical protein
MRTVVSEFPKRPSPDMPESRPQVQPPTVFVYERQEWEYKVIDAPALSEADLNTLGKDGWELTGVVSARDTVQFYFKRLRS